MSDREVTKTLRLSEKDICQVMQDLDSSGGVRPIEAKRCYKRWNLRGTVAVLAIVDEHGNRRNYAVEPRDLSSSGMGALHGTFLHPGTLCTVGLRRLDGTAASIRAEVVRCRLIRSGVHELGVRFEERINPMEFIATDLEQSFQYERVDLDSLSGTVMLVVENRVEQRLLASHFSGSGLDFLYASRGEDACAMLTESPSLVFVDHAVEDWSGIELLRRLREAGAMTPIVLLSADRWRHVRETAIDAGADDVLMKPVSRELLWQATAEYLERRSGEGEDASVHYVVVSAAHVGVELALLEEYVEELSRLGGEIGAALDGMDTESLRKRALDLHGTANGFGFGAVGRRAEELLTALTKGEEEQVKLAGDLLRELCGRCRAVA